VRTWYAPGVQERPLEEFAAATAELDAGLEREAVLTRIGVSEDEWLAVQEHWLLRMGQDAARQRFELSARYQTLFLAHRRALEKSRRTAAPAAPEELDGATTAQDDAPSEEAPFVAATYAAPPEAAPPPQRFVPSAGAPPPPPFVPPANTPPPLPFGPTASAPPLPFAPAPPPFAQAPPAIPSAPAASAFAVAPALVPPGRTAPPAEREDLSSTRPASQADRPAGVPNALPFLAQQPAAPSPRRADMSGLPFRAPPAPPNPPAAPPRRAPRAETVAFSLPVTGGAALPFRAATGAPAGAPDIATSLERYAALCAELACFPNDGEAVLRRYGLDDLRKRGVVLAGWKQRLRSNPSEYELWRKLQDEHVARLRQPR
jgi:hypothetical protein